MQKKSIIDQAAAVGDSSPNRCDHNDKNEQSGLDGLEKDSCVKCDEVGEMKMLVCNETRCPVVIHEGCLTRKANYDDLGNFYCPYCAYKRAVDKVQRVKQIAMSAKEKLSKFLKDGKEPENEKKEKAGEQNADGEFNAAKNVENENHESHYVIVSEGSEDGEQNAKPPKSKTTVRKIPSHKKKVQNVFPSQRKGTRLMWTPKEEEMLKDGVALYAKQDMKNLPWRNILKLGSRVFHKTRLPVDLQNKWKNMNRKK